MPIKHCKFIDAVIWLYRFQLLYTLKRTAPNFVDFAKESPEFWTSKKNCRLFPGRGRSAECLPPGAKQWRTKQWRLYPCIGELAQPMQWSFLARIVSNSAYNSTHWIPCWRISLQSRARLYGGDQGLAIDRWHSKLICVVLDASSLQCVIN